MSTNAENNSSITIIVIGIVVGVLCCVISLVLMFLLFRTPSDPKIAPGLIGGPCNKGKCTAPKSICKFDMCYEECKGRNAWPCENDSDIPYTKTYWCDYSSCPAWVPPKSPNSEQEAGPSLFDQALKQQQAIDAKTAAIKIAQQEAQLEQQAQQKQQAASDAAQQKQWCKCAQMYVDGQILHGTCAVGPYYKDGGFAQPWCYVSGGTQCKTATKSANEALAGSAWRVCDPKLDT